MPENNKNLFVFEDIQPKDERIGARIKPQYRKMLDIIARDRQTNISEVLELAIHKLSESYKIENQSVVDFLDYRWKHVEHLFYGLRFIPLPPAKSIMQKEYLNIRKIVLNYLPESELPLSLYSPQERYSKEVIEDLRLQPSAWYSIMPEDLFYFVYKSWHIGQSTEMSIDILQYTDTFVRDVLWKKYTVDTSKDIIDKDLANNYSIFFQGFTNMLISKEK